MNFILYYTAMHCSEIKSKVKHEKKKKRGSDTSVA